MIFLTYFIVFIGLFLNLVCSQRNFNQRGQSNQRGQTLPGRINSPCSRLTGGKFCQQVSSYPKVKELNAFGKQQSGRSIFIVEDPFWRPPFTRYCAETHEIIAPRWALSQNGEGRYIVQNEDFVQKVFFRYCASNYNGLGSRCFNFGTCDQQYHLIQLRVYDEVYGIFSDWFEVPSGCYCKSN